MEVEKRVLGLAELLGWSGRADEPGGRLLDEILTLLERHEGLLERRLRVGGNRLSCSDVYGLWGESSLPIAAAAGSDVQAVETLLSELPPPGGPVEGG